MWTADTWWHATCINDVIVLSRFILGENTLSVFMNDTVFQVSKRHFVKIAGNESDRTSE